MTFPTYDVEKVASSIGDAIRYLQSPDDPTVSPSDPTGITNTGDVISQVKARHPELPQFTAADAASPVTPMAGSLTDGIYDGFSVSQEYGIGGHPGLDIATPVGTKLLAPIHGTVTHAASDDPGGYGSWVEITGDDGTVVRYGHLSGINVHAGETVDSGTMIGLTGGALGDPGAGNATGPHLHFEVHQGGPTVDPSRFLAGGWQIFGQ